MASNVQGVFATIHQQMKEGQRRKKTNRNWKIRFRKINKRCKIHFKKINTKWRLDNNNGDVNR